MWHPSFSPSCPRDNRTRRTWSGNAAGQSSPFSNSHVQHLAGFVEPGETLEEAVVREVQEETGITVKEIRYFGSQPWPFPHSLMIGFTASYAGGQITLSDEENVDAGWFTADNLPSLPDKISIARKLIDSFLKKQGKAPGLQD